MLSEEEQGTKLKEKRILKLQNMLNDIKKEIVRKVLRMSHDTSSNKKYRKNRKVYCERARTTSNFVKNASETFFSLISNEEQLQLTTEADVIQKVQKFKKNVSNACQKMMQNIDQTEQLERSYRSMESKSKIEENDDDDDGDDRRQGGRRSPSKSRSKNFKISHQSTLSMMQWLLQNFENPYPSNEQKQKMARDGSIPLMKVNNWFINARERTVKSYFIKE